MTQFISAAASGAPAKPSHSLRKLLRDPIGVTAGVILLAMVVAGVTAPWLAPTLATTTDLDAVNAPPGSTGLLLGGDGSGRDIFSRLIWGAQQTLIACSVILVVSLIVGVPAGLLGGFYRGALERILDWISDVVMSLPGIVLLIALFALTGPNLVALMAVFGLLVAPGYFRLVRSIVVGVREELYIDAAKVAGLSDLRIMGRHVLWAVRGPVVIQSSFILAAGIAIEAAISLIGLTDPARASWGSMLQEAFANIYNNRPAILWPVLAIAFTTLALVLLGNSLRDALQPSAPVEGHALTARSRARIAAHIRAKNPIATQSIDESQLLSVRGLRVAYGTTDQSTEVVRGVDLDLGRGEIRGLVGESGSGKSQTAFAILGILPKEAIVVGGAVVFDGRELLSEGMQGIRGRRIAYIPQEPMSNLDPTYTVGAQLVAGLRAAVPQPKAVAAKRIVTLLARVGIREPERVFAQYPHQISGGMAQRVLICGAVASDPDLIIADEPTTALDVTVQAEVLDLLRELRDERGLGVLLVTHNFGVVADLCDSVSVMKNGEIVESSDILSIFTNPSHPYTRQLLASTRRVDLEEEKR